MLRRFSLNFAIFSMALDGLLVAMAFYAAAILRPLMNDLPFIAPLREDAVMPVGLYLLLPVCWIAVFASVSLYDGKRYIRAVDEFTALTFASILASVALAGILYLSYREISRAQFLLFVLFSYTSFLLWRALVRLFFRMMHNSNATPARRVLIVGTGPIGKMVEERLKDGQEYDLTLAGFVDDDPPESFAGRLLGPVSDLGATITNFGITDVIIAYPPNFYGEVRKTALVLDAIPVRVWIALGFFDLALYKTAIEDFGGLPLLNLRASALNDYERMLKRSFDLVFSIFVLVLTFPVLLLAALAILLDDGAPFLFLQKRVGENGKVFDIYKLRTMVRNAEQLRQKAETRDADGNLIHKTREDPRVTRVGRVLRRFSIDELPQLVNVIRGEMSLVGPRPELPRLVEQYQPWQRQRLAVPPGITGWWQVTGRSDKVMHLHTEDDLYYVQNYSIWLDLQIIMRTLWVVLLGKGAY